MHACSWATAEIPKYHKNVNQLGTAWGAACSGLRWRGSMSSGTPRQCPIWGRQGRDGRTGGSRSSFDKSHNSSCFITVPQTRQTNFCLPLFSVTNMTLWHLGHSHRSDSLPGSLPGNLGGGSCVTEILPQTIVSYESCSGKISCRKYIGQQRKELVLQRAFKRAAFRDLEYKGTCKVPAASV